MNFLIYSRETETFDSYPSAPRRLPDGLASGEFIAQRNIRFRAIGSPLLTSVTKKFEPETRSTQCGARTR